MSSDFQLKCARCGRSRWSRDGVCPACGYEVVTSPTVVSADGREDDGPEAQAPTRRPWLLLLLGGVVAIALAQLSFGLSASTTLPAAGVVSILLGVALIASYTALVDPHTPSEKASSRLSQKATEDPPTKYREALAGAMEAFRNNDVRWAGPLVGVVLLPVLLFRVWGDRGDVWNLLIWCAVIFTFGIFFAPSGFDAAHDKRGDAGGRIRGWLRHYPQRLAAAARHHFGDLLPLLAILLVYCAIAMPNLTAWRYSAIGDEYLFYKHASQVLEDGMFRPFSQEGVYGHHPQLNTIYKAAIMWLFGDGHFGWKMSGVVSMSLATAGIYVLGYVLYSRSAAVLAAGLFAASHYLLGLVNVGANHTDALMITAWALAFFIMGLRSGNPLFLYLAGCVVGLGFYFHYSARITGLVMLVTALLAIKPRQILTLWPVALGIVLTAWPTVLAARADIVTKMVAQSAVGYSEAVSGPVAQRLFNNLAINLPAFHFNQNSHSYVGGPLLDPVTGALAAVGLGLAIGTAGRLASIVPLVWIVVAFAATGLVSPYPATAITRLFPLVAPLALLAGTAVASLLDLLPPRVRMDSRRRLLPAVWAVFLVVVLVLNVNQSWSATHGEYHYTAEALSVGASRHQHCGNSVDRTMFIGADPGSILESALASYHPESQSHPRRIYREWPPEAPLPEPTPHCVIFVDPNTPNARALQASLKNRYPDGALYVFTTLSDKNRIEYFHVAGTPSAQ